MTSQLALFNLEVFTKYDSSQEPPDPDEYPTPEAYESAWASWERRFPQLVPLVKGMSDDNSLSLSSSPTPHSPLPAPQHNKQVTTTTISAPVIPRVGEQVTTTTKKSAPQHEATHWVEKYWVERSGNKYWYWRYMFMEGRKIQRVYIGAVGSPKAQAKKSAVEVAIEDGRFSPGEIVKMIRTWR